MREYVAGVRVKCVSLYMYSAGTR